MPARCVDSPIGLLTLIAENGYLTELRFGFSARNDPDPVLDSAVLELDEYFNGVRQTFDIPLNPCGTPFQTRVWNALKTIPYGRTLSYGEIARLIGNPNACRAVGMANHVNPIPILIPCHRVIGKDGSLTGYGGGIGIKRALLQLEQEHMNGII